MLSVLLCDGWMNSKPLSPNLGKIKRLVRVPSNLWALWRRPTMWLALSLSLSFSLLRSVSPMKALSLRVTKTTSLKPIIILTVAPPHDPKRPGSPFACNLFYKLHLGPRSIMDSSIPLTEEEWIHVEVLLGITERGSENEYKQFLHELFEHARGGRTSWQKFLGNPWEITACLKFRRGTNCSTPITDPPEGLWTQTVDLWALVS